jgi:SAM-dependent methyltransferase
VAGVLRRFLDANRRLSRRLERRLPQARENVQREWEERVGQILGGLPPGSVVVDVGGGRRCHFAHRRRPGSGVRIVAVDVSAEELALNHEVDEKRVGDATRGLPLADGEAAMIVTRSVLEHLRDVEPFVADAARALAPGGWFVHVFPSKYAPFSLANRLLPHSLASRLLRLLIPGSEGRLGFRAYYDRTYASGMRQLLERHGFAVEELRVGWYQSEYFGFLVPLYAASALYELAVRAAGAQDLAANVLIVARRPVSAAVPNPFHLRDT